MALTREFHPGNPENLVGRTFGRLKVVAEAEKSKGNRRWACSCECGGAKTVFQVNLANGRTRSCGCLLRDVRRRTAYSHLDALRTFGAGPG